MSRLKNYSDSIHSAMQKSLVMAAYVLDANGLAASSKQDGIW